MLLPRFVDSFLKELDGMGAKKRPAAVVAERIDQQFIFKAHEAAAMG